MSRINATRFAWVPLGLGLVLGLVVGCGKDKKDGPTDGPAPGGPPLGASQSPQEVLAKLPGGDEHAAGKRVYANNGCVRCHKLGETGGPMMGGPPAPKLPPGAPPMPPMPGTGGGAPDLTSVGAAAEHTKLWLADHVRDPKKHKAESTMPAFGADKIGDADLDSLAAYLAGRKDEKKKE